MTTTADAIVSVLGEAPRTARIEAVLSSSFGFERAKRECRAREPDVTTAAAAIVSVLDEAPRTARIEAVLSSSFGFDGQNASVVPVSPT
jgi:3-oxoacyl-(acyl-carrier-protein) synthase